MQRARTLRSLLLVPSSLALGCGDDGTAAVEVRARGTIGAFGRTGETALAAEYSSTLDDESCEVLDGRSECVLVRCSADDAAPLENAGEVSVREQALDRAEDNSYSLVLDEELVPGELLALEASGSSAVPKHSSKVVVPERTELETSLTDPLVLDPGADFVFAWTPVESDRVVLSLVFGELEVACQAAGMVGSITIASRLVNALPDGTAGTFTVVNQNLAESSVKGWRIWFGANHVLAEGAAELAVP